MATNTREIVTFQFGHFANFVGTHCWNLQDATFAYSPSEVKYPKQINHDVLFREGKNLSGELTYTPRLVAFDLKGSLNTLKQDGILYDFTLTDEDVLWRNDVTLHKLDVTTPKNEFLRDLYADTENEQHSDEKEKPSREADEHDSDESKTMEQGSSADAIFGKKYYDLDDSIAVWSDFLRVHLHPKSVHVVEQYRHGESAFDLYGYGEQLYRDVTTKTAIEDRVHFFLEECDHLQGMQMFVDMYDGFGGLASSVLEEICDDYSNKSVLIYSVTPTVFADDSIPSECYRVLNTVLSLDKLVSHSSMVVPISLASSLWKRPGPARTFPFVNYKPDLSYHSSALLASAVENMSVPLRLESNATLLPHLTDSMATQGRKITALQSCFPIARRKNQYLVDYLLQLGDAPPWQCLTPYCTPTAQPWAQSLVIQGISNDNVKGPPDPRLPAAMNNCRTVDDVINLYLTDTYSIPLNAVCNVRRPCPVTTPFPHVFDERINIEGEMAHKPRPKQTGVEEVPMMTCLQATNDVTKYITALIKETSKYNISKFHKFLENGLEIDSYTETLENLRTLNKCYGDEQDDDSDDLDIDET